MSGRHQPGNDSCLEEAFERFNAIMASLQTAIVNMDRNVSELRGEMRALSASVASISDRIGYGVSS